MTCRRFPFVFQDYHLIITKPKNSRIHQDEGNGSLQPSGTNFSWNLLLPIFPPNQHLLPTTAASLLHELQRSVHLLLFRRIDMIAQFHHLLGPRIFPSIKQENPSEWTRVFLPINISFFRLCFWNYRVLFLNFCLFSFRRAEMVRIWSLCIAT